MDKSLGSKTIGWCSHLFVMGLPEDVLGKITVFKSKPGPYDFRNRLITGRINKDNQFFSFEVERFKFINDEKYRRVMIEGFMLDYDLIQSDGPKKSEPEEGSTEGPSEIKFCPYCGENIEGIFT